MAAAVEVEGLQKRYGRRLAVDGVSLRVEQGEIFGLLGPNGSGKTTTVECIQGLRHPDGGRICVFGLDVQSEGARVRHLVGSQLQDSALPERLRVWEALKLFSSIGGAQRPWQELLEEWGLAEQSSTAFGDLSGGQRQRLFVALALVADPQLVVLDEMTTGLDPVARRVAWDLVSDVRRRGTTVVLVTHFMDEAQHLCDRLALLVEGRVVVTGTAEQLIQTYRPGAVVRFSVPDMTQVSFLQQVGGVQSVRSSGGAVEVSGSGPLLARVGHALVEHGLEPGDLRAELPTLGVLRRFQATAISPAVLVLAHMTVTAIGATAGAVLLVAVSFAGYNVSPPSSWAGVLIAYLVVTAAFVSLGALLGFLLPTARAAQGLGVLLFFVFMMLGGAGPPREVLPSGLGGISDVVPVTYAARMIRGPWTGRGWDGTGTLVIVGMLLASLLATVWLVGRRGSRG